MREGRLFFQRGNTIGEEDAKLWCLDAATGANIWKAPLEAQFELYAAPTVVDGKVWINAGDTGGLYGFREADGSQLFFRQLPQIDGWTPTYYRGALYTWLQGQLRAHDPLSGVVQWGAGFSWNGSGASANNVAAIADDRAFLIGSSGLHAIDLVTRLAKWSVPGYFRGWPGVEGSAVLAITGSQINAYAVDSGQLLGSYLATETLDLEAQPIVTDDRVFAASSTATWIFDRASFQRLQTIPHGGALSFAGGTLFIANSGSGQLSTWRLAGAESPQPVAITDAAVNVTPLPDPEPNPAPEPSPSSPPAPADALFEAAIELRSIDAYAVALGDLNGDGRTDVAITGAPIFDALVQVFLQNGAGELVKGPTHAGGNGISIASADINGDQRDDVIVTGREGLSVLTQTLAGVLNPAALIRGEHSTTRLHVGDFNDDGHADVVAASGATENVDVYLQGAAGLEAPSSPFLRNQGSNDLVVADLNSDGRDDILSMSGQGRGPSLSVLLQLPGGALTRSTQDYWVVPQGYVSAFAAGDFDHDGRSDVAFSATSYEPDEDQLVILRQEASGFLSRGFTMGAYPPDALAAGDLNGDGRDDLVALNGSSLRVFVQLASGGFAPPASYSAGVYSNASQDGLAIGDINNDGAPDVVATGDGGLFIFPHRQILSPSSVTARRDKPFTFQVLAGNRATRFEADNLPAGLAIDPATGVISGTPTVAGDFSVTLRGYRDAKLCAGTLALRVLPPPEEVTGSYVILLQDLSGASFYTTGRLAVTITPNGRFTGVLRIGREGIPLQGRMLEGAAQLLIENHPFFGTFAIHLAIDTGARPVVLSAAVGASGWRTEGVGGKRIVAAEGEPVASAGRYTFAVGLAEADLTEHLPNGFGAGTLEVTPRGEVRMCVRLPKGGLLMHGAPMCADGTWSFQIRTHDASGMLTGTIAFADAADSDCTGQLLWFKPVGSPRYALDFGAALTLRGSRYDPALAPFAPGAAVTASFELGDLYEPFAQHARVRADGQLRIAEPGALGTQLQLDRASGWVTGTFLHPRSGDLVKVRGIIVTKASAALGFFRGPVHSGAFLLTPRTP